MNDYVITKNTIIKPKLAGSPLLELSTGSFYSLRRSDGWYLLTFQGKSYIVDKKQAHELLDRSELHTGD